jgi:hypothetical protein
MLRLPRKRGWGRIRPYRHARAGTHAWLELAASPGRESFTSVSGGVDSLQIRGGTRCAREGEEGGGRAAAAPKAAPPCVAARLDAVRRRPRVGPPTSPRVRWGCGTSPPGVWRRCGPSQWVSWVGGGTAARAGSGAVGPAVQLRREGVCTRSSRHTDRVRGSAGRGSMMVARVDDAVLDIRPERGRGRRRRLRWGSGAA